MKRFTFFRGYPQPDNFPFIPDELHYFYESALLTLAGAEKIPREFTGEEVFKKVRQKFNNAIGHVKAAKRVSFFLVLFFYQLFNSFFLFLFKLLAAEESNESPLLATSKGGKVKKISKKMSKLHSEGN